MARQVFKIFLRSVILLIALLISDRIIGTGLEYLFYQQTHGDDYTTLYALDKTNDEVLIFGTSRASHHYQSAIITEKTGYSCFNAGRDEMEIPYTEALLPVIFERYHPKVIILDIGPIELAGEKQIVYERIATVLMPFAAKYPQVKSTIALAGDMELLKMKASKIYPYNSKIGSAIQNSYTNLGHSSESGYEPLYKTIDTSVYKESIWDDMNKNLPLNRQYIATLEDIMNTTKAAGVKLVIAISPFYFYNDFDHNDSYNRIKRMVEAHPEVILLDFSNDSRFTGNPLLFNDDVHLNDKGAAIYTRTVVEALKQKGIF